MLVRRAMQYPPMLSRLYDHVLHRGTLFVPKPDAVDRVANSRSSFQLPDHSCTDHDRASIDGADNGPGKVDELRSAGLHL